MNNSIQPIGGTTNPSQSGSGSNSNEGVHFSPQTWSLTSSLEKLVDTVLWPLNPCSLFKAKILYIYFIITMIYGEIHYRLLSHKTELIVCT